MDAATLAIIAELAKFGIITFIAYLRQAGLTDEQIDQVFQEAKNRMLVRNPADIPNI